MNLIRPILFFQFETTQIYNADIQAIRNLAEISQKLQRGGITIPGNLTVKGNIKCGI